MTKNGTRAFYAMLALLFGAFIACWATGPFGHRCTVNKPPWGLAFMTAFQVLWGPFALYQMRKSELMSMNKSNLKESLKKAKTLALDNKKKKEYNEIEMKNQQVHMFIFLQGAITLIYIIQFS